MTQRACSSVPQQELTSFEWQGGNEEPVVTILQRRIRCAHTYTLTQSQRHTSTYTLRETKHFRTDTHSLSISQLPCICIGFKWGHNGGFKTALKKCFFVSPRTRKQHTHRATKWQSRKGKKMSERVRKREGVKRAEEKKKTEQCKNEQKGNQKQGPGVSATHLVAKQTHVKMAAPVWSLCAATMKQTLPSL